MKRFVLFAVFLLVTGIFFRVTEFNSSLLAGVSPAVVGNTDDDSIWVSFAVNDTLGNADDCDSAWVVRFYHGRAFDSTKLTGEHGSRDGLYATAFRAADGDSCGAYWVQVRVYGVDGRDPHTTYGYAVVEQGVTGLGAVPVYVHCLSAKDSTSIQGVKINVRLAADQTPKHRTISAGDGWAPMTLEEYDHLVYATANGFYFTVPACTLAVAGDSLRDTIWAIAFDPGSPGDPELCRVYGWVYDLGGEKMENAVITARLASAPVRHENVIISPYEKAASSDSSGYWYLDVFPTACLTPDTVRYEFTIRHTGGAIVRRKVSVPDTSNWQLSW